MWRNMGRGNSDNSLFLVPLVLLSIAFLVMDLTVMVSFCSCLIIIGFVVNLGYVGLSNFIGLCL